MAASSAPRSAPLPRAGGELPAPRSAPLPAAGGRAPVGALTSSVALAVRAPAIPCPEAKQHKTSPSPPQIAPRFPREIRNWHSCLPYPKTPSANQCAQSGFCPLNTQRIIFQPLRHRPRRTLSSATRSARESWRSVVFTRLALPLPLQPADSSGQACGFWGVRATQRTVGLTRVAVSRRSGQKHPSGSNTTSSGSPALPRPSYEPALRRSALVSTPVAALPRV